MNKLLVLPVLGLFLVPASAFAASITVTPDTVYDNESVTATCDGINWSDSAHDYMIGVYSPVWKPQRFFNNCDELDDEINMVLFDNGDGAIQMEGDYSIFIVDRAVIGQGTIDPDSVENGWMGDYPWVVATTTVHTIAGERPE